MSETYISVVAKTGLESLIPHIEERRFAVHGRPDRGQIVIRYEGWSEAGAVQARAILDNDWFGYQLTVESLVLETTADLED